MGGRPNGLSEATTSLLDCSSDGINIITLGGDFDIQYQGQSLLTSIQRCYKLLELLRYFIVFRNRRMLPETIIENFWPSVDCSDPRMFCVYKYTGYGKSWRRWPLSLKVNRSYV